MTNANPTYFLFNIVAVAVLLLMGRTTSAFTPLRGCQASSTSPFSLSSSPFSSATRLYAQAPSEEKKSLTMPDSISFPDINLSTVTDALADLDVDQLSENIRGDGSQPLGSRGELYFVAQVVLLVLIAVGGVPFIGPPLWALGGPGLLLGGAIVSFLALVDLGSDSLSPFPDPPADGDLKTDGIYSKMRHPMYTSLIMVAGGLSILTNSADRLLLTALLVYLLEVKSSKEEDFLIAKYGIDYTEYMEKVPGKFFPADLLDDLPWNKKEDL